MSLSPLIFSHSMDFTRVFEDSFKTQVGISIFRIEELNIVLTRTGDFCIGDCYIILSTTMDVVSYEYNYHIQTWIGSKAELDKRFCSAMYAVGLKNFLSSPCRILVQYQDEESLEFLEMFPNFTCLDESQSSKSGLYPVLQREFPVLLYKIYGKYDFRLSLVFTCSLHFI